MQRNYKMVPVASEILPEGVSGFTAQFEGVGSVDAFKFILPDVITDNGLKIGTEIAQTLIRKFLVACVEYVGDHGEPVNVENTLLFNVYARGLYATKDARVAKDKLHLGVQTLGSLKPAWNFTLSNTTGGKVIDIYSVTGTKEGCESGTVTVDGNVRINGRYMKMLEGDTVVAAYGEDEDKVTAQCAIIESADDYVIVSLPDVMKAAPAGTDLTFTVNNHAGDPEGAAQTKSKKAKMVAYSGNPIIAYFEQAGKARGEFGVDADAIVTIKGAGFTRPNIISAKFGKLEAGGNSFAYAFNPTAITVIDANTVTCKVSAAEDPDQTDETLSQDSAAGLIVLRAFTQMTRSNDLVARYVA